jgi:hypothetical protein
MCTNTIITMRTPRNITTLLGLSMLVVVTLVACAKDEGSGPAPQVPLSAAEQEMLLFMLEEEKLARDTYVALDAHWAAPQFANITSSERSHMDKIATLLAKYGVAYTVLPAGTYAHPELQALYDQFMIDGVVSEANALHIGATIEDLDIVDLQQRMDATANVDIDAAFAKLQCGSRNHLRAFVGAIIASGGTYTPQFMDQASYDAILAAEIEGCGGN